MKTNCFNAVIDFTQQYGFNSTFIWYVGSSANIEFTPAKAIDPDDLRCGLVYTIDPFDVSVDSWAKIFCDQDYSFCYASLFTSQPIDDYEIKVNACTDDGTNCETIKFAIKFEQLS
jgi:hypothetical protein